MTLNQLQSIFLPSNLTFGEIWQGGYM